MVLLFQLPDDEYVRCPNSGEVLAASKSDNKVMCRCGKKNPRFPGREEAIDLGGCVHHVTAFLPPATLEEYEKEFLRKLEAAP